ncbi:MAG: T9SS type A sorting domain-containing protein [Crocinitomicaceae bacterium]
MRLLLSLFILSSISLTSFSQKTYIPDDGFEEALIFEGLDTVLDDSITTSIIDTLTFLELEPFGIVDLTGIEDFAALEILVCRNNDIQQLDLSDNPNLEFLNCENNDLTNLNVENCLHLKHLFAENNNLSSVNVALCLQLETLDVSQNPINSGNFISANTALTTVRFSNCNLSSSNFTFNVNLEVLDISINPQLTTLDITSCSQLITLGAFNSGLTGLDLSYNTQLQNALLMGNEITSLDLQNNTLLTNITCYNNNLSSLTLPPVDTQSSSILATMNNPNLTCIQCNDPNYVNANWTVSIDPTTTISALCNVGIDELEVDVDIFPNPSYDGWISVNSATGGEFQLIGLDGSKLQTGEISHGTNTLDFSMVSKGMYILQLTLNNQITTRQIELF